MQDNKLPLCVCVCVCVSKRESVPPVVVLDHRLQVPARGEGAEAFAEALVVDGPRVNGEEPHQQNQIASSEQHLPDLTHTGQTGYQWQRWRETAQTHQARSSQQPAEQCFWYALYIDIDISMCI